MSVVVDPREFGVGGVGARGNEIVFDTALNGTSVSGGVAGNEQVFYCPISDASRAELSSTVKAFAAYSLLASTCDCSQTKCYRNVKIRPGRVRPARK